MKLIETRDGFHLTVDSRGPFSRAIAKDLLHYMRTNDIEFLVGGVVGQVVLTIEPLVGEQREQLKNWWTQRG